MPNSFELLSYKGNARAEGVERMISDLVKHGAEKTIDAILATANLAEEHEPDVALSIAVSVLLSLFVKAEHDLGLLPCTQASECLNEAFEKTKLPFKLVRTDR